MNAATLRAPLRFEGIGLHSGTISSMVVRPAASGAGYRFRLGDVEIPATAEYASESPLATVIGHNGTSISTIEHILSALMGSGISDAEIEIDGSEIPILDGSAKRFTDAIARAGVVRGDAERAVFRVERPYELREGDKAVIVLPSKAFRVRFVAEYDAPIGIHYFDAVITPERYAAEIASARTFAFLRDVEAMREQGLALGGTLDNALVYDDRGPMQPLQWPNEVVRHKVLDLIGDFALLGAWPLCDVIAIKSGHAMHTRVVRELRERV
jgi:UDP-3-O-[3-hydroxymyristoyl] N-acetylglucosamine deacetylase